MFSGLGGVLMENGGKNLCWKECRGMFEDLIW